MVLGAVEKNVFRANPDNQMDGQNGSNLFRGDKLFKDQEKNAETLTEQAYRYAGSTWNGLKTNIDPITGLPPDRYKCREKESPPQTSPTNIGLLLIDSINALDLGLESFEEVIKQLLTLTNTLIKMERVNGLFDNWYDFRTGKRLEHWPVENGQELPHKLSSIDNAWLAVGLMMVVERLTPEIDDSRPEVKMIVDNCNKLLEEMDFNLFLMPGEKVFRMCYYPSEEEVAQAKAGQKIEKDPKNASKERYWMLNSETRLVYWAALALRQVPWPYYFSMWRTPPDYGFNEAQNPQGDWNTYEGIKVYNGYFEVDNVRFLPSHVGAAFESFSVTQVVDEETWFPESWGEQNRAVLKIMKKNAVGPKRIWGKTTGDTPSGYAEQGEPELSYRTDFKSPQNIINPSASFMTLSIDPEAALKNLANIESIPGMYSAEYGFADACVVADGYRDHTLTTPVNGEKVLIDESWSLIALANLLLEKNKPKDLFTHYLMTHNPKAIHVIEAGQKERFFPSRNGNGSENGNLNSHLSQMTEVSAD